MWSNHSILLDKLVKDELAKWRRRWVEDWLYRQAKKVEIVVWSPTGSWFLMVSHRRWCWHHCCLMSLLVSCMMGTGLQIIPNWWEWLVHWKVGDAIQRDLGRLEKWSERNRMKFNKAKQKNPASGRELNPCTSTGWGLTGWKAALQKKTWWSWWMASWTWVSSLTWQQRWPTPSWAEGA